MAFIVSDLHVRYVERVFIAVLTIVGRVLGRFFAVASWAATTARYFVRVRGRFCVEFRNKPARFAETRLQISDHRDERDEALQQMSERGGHVPTHGL